MATSPITAASTAGSSIPPPALLVHLASLSPDSLSHTLAHLAAAFPGEPLLVASPDTAPRSIDGITLINYAPAASAGWVLTAADFLSTFQLAQDHNSPPAILLLGPESHSLSPEALRALAAPLRADGDARSGRDLVLPLYHLGPHEGLVNSGILYPLTCALFSCRARFPLAIDLGLSPRMTQRLASVANRIPAAVQSEGILWPVAEAATASYSLAEVPAGPRALPAPATLDLNSVLARVAGSLFSDIEAKAAYWQRVRPASHAESPATPGVPAASHLGRWDAVPPLSLPEDLTATIAPMLDSFHLAYTNLQEIWALVLPPNSLVGLKKLSLLSAENFRLPDALWVRIVYDFLLAYRLRTLNRGHLLGALTPLYLAWAASHLQLTAAGLPPEQHIEQLAAAFESDKPYLVSRWRWPDRFNP